MKLKQQDLLFFPHFRRIFPGYYFGVAKIENWREERLRPTDGRRPTDATAAMTRTHAPHEEDDDDDDDDAYGIMTVTVAYYGYLLLR